MRGLSVTELLFREPNRVFNSRLSLPSVENAECWLSVKLVVQQQQQQQGCHLFLSVRLWWGSIVEMESNGHLPCKRHREDWQGSGL